MANEETLTSVYNHHDTYALPSAPYHFRHRRWVVLRHFGSERARESLAATPDASLAADSAPAHPFVSSTQVIAIVGVINTLFLYPLVTKRVIETGGAAAGRGGSGPTGADGGADAAGVAGGRTGGGAPPPQPSSTGVESLRERTARIRSHSIPGECSLRNLDIDCSLALI
ncbi:hypothetical protein B296_00020225 [Ensete ventricosum]|uniref:Uncharacterized protein n=1 Tax=Ensete ventricosum TaxID=4639 RepID=A0A427ADX5_ENSVE|nr:hypothetical protein B296_00020225 [Ensete ventricosum]